MKSKVTGTFTTAAIIWLNCCILAAAFTGVSYIWAWARPGGVQSAAPLYSTTAHASAIHTLSAADTARLFRLFDEANGGDAYAYRPWVGFSERPYHSSLLNIDDGAPLPTRRTIEPAEAEGAAKTIWLFGGSTQYGWGVPDGQTVASHLAAILAQRGTPYRVVNQGHAFWFSSQEAALFMDLLRQGRKCDVAVFLDGLNDYYQGPSDRPRFTDRAAEAFARDEQAALERRSIKLSLDPSFPPLRILNSLLRRKARPATQPGEEDIQASTVYNPASAYVLNASAIQKTAEAAGIQAEFFWQPTPFEYIGGADKHREDFIKPPFPVASVTAEVRSKFQSKSFHFIADLFASQSYDDIYVDRTHYGDTGCRMVAQAIADGLTR